MLSGCSFLGADLVPSVPVKGNLNICQDIFDNSILLALWGFCEL